MIWQNQPGSGRRQEVTMSGYWECGGFGHWKDQGAGLFADKLGDGFDERSYRSLRGWVTKAA
ncbi:MAG: hypothetical protein WCA99_01370 [Candidatus Sulfotelmatobacter sp.]